MKILNKILNNRCNYIEERYPENDRYINIRKMDYGYKAFDVTFEDDFFKSCFDEDILNTVFSEDNKEFFKKQAIVPKDYLEKVGETNCIKKDLMNSDDFHTTYNYQNNYTISKILFTEDYKYAIFKDATPNNQFISIYRLETGEYKSFRSCTLAIY